MKIIYILSISLLLFSCNKKRGSNDSTEQIPILEEASDGSNASDAAPMGYTSSGEGAAELSSIKFTPPEMEAKEFSVQTNEVKAPVSKKLIKDGTLEFKTKNLAQAKRQIDTAIRRMGAYYDQEVFSSSDEQNSFHLVVRIPSASFEQFIKQLENPSLELISKSIQTRDVTTEYMDVETRLNNKKTYLNKYLELLKQAKSIKDILALQENIRVLQEEIESSEGQLKYLNSQISFSTLTLELINKKTFVFKPEEQSSFAEMVKESLTNGWHSVKQFVLYLIQNWPALIVLALVWYWFKKRKKKSAVK